MSSNTFIQDSLTRHQVFLNRYAGGVSNEIEELLDDLIKDIDIQLRSSGDLEEMPAQQLVSIRANLQGMVNNLGITGIVDSSSNDLAKHEVEYMENLLKVGTSADIIFTSPEHVFSIVSKAPMVLTSTSGKVQRLTISEMVNGFTSKVPGDVTRLVRIGIGQGDSVDTIARRVKSRVKNRTKREAQALTRTIANHVGQEGRKIAMVANQDVIVGERYVATLDSRTTLICAKWDGSVHKVNRGPHPPLHWNCRSTRTPVINPDFNLDDIEGERPAIGENKDGTKTRGVVNAQTNYSGWLKRQSKGFQDDVLGVERGKLFRSGRVTLDRFVDNVGGTITLDKLRDKDGLPVINS